MNKKKSSTEHLMLYNRSVSLYKITGKVDIYVEIYKWLDNKLSNVYDYSPTKHFKDHIFYGNSMGKIFLQKDYRNKEIIIRFHYHNLYTDFFKYCNKMFQTRHSHISNFITKIIAEYVRKEMELDFDDIGFTWINNPNASKEIDSFQD